MSRLRPMPAAPAPVRRAAGALLALLAAAGPALPQAPPAAEAAVVERLESLIRREIERGAMTGLSIALVDDQRTVWSAGFGLADRASKRPVDADTVYRVGSISKLFTALAVMALVDDGKLDLDAPITRWVPEFSIGRAAFPDAKPTTLRQLMCHRSGFVRESPVGSYFDASEPSLEASVRSLRGCELVHAPETVTKYSNIGVALEGLVAEKAAGIGFEELQRARILDPLGMKQSDFRVTDRVRGRLAKGYMRLAGGSEIEAPLFELGTIPAGNLFAPVTDMARFIAFLFRDGALESGPLVRADTLRSMYEVQYAADGRKTGFGLGFFIGELGGRKTIGHGGAVYGFSSQILALPEEKLGVIVCANDDVVNGATGAIARRAVEWLLAARGGQAPPPLAELTTLAAADIERLVGHYRAGDDWMELRRDGDRLRAHRMGTELELRPVAPERLLAFGGSWFETPVDVTAGRDGAPVLTMQGKTFTRYDPAALAAEPPADWKPCLGVYGPSFIPTVIEFRNGKLYALVENAFGYVMEPAGRDAFDFPAGLYEGEKLTFGRTADGAVDRVRIGPVEFLRQERSIITPGNTWGLWAVIVLWVAISIGLEQRFRWAAKVSGPVIVLLGAVLLSNIPIAGAAIIPRAAPIYDLIWDYIVPVCVPLLLFRANIRAIVRESGRVFVTFHLAAIGTVAGALLAALVLRGAGVADLESLIAIMTGSYIGGGINFVALTKTYEPDPGLVNSLLVADNLVMTALFLVCFAMPSMAILRRIYGAPYQEAIERSGEGAETAAASYWQPRPIGLFDIARALGIAVGIAAVAHLIARGFESLGAGSDSAALGIVRSFLAQPYLVMTVLCVTIATCCSRQLARIAGAEELGTYLIYLFFFVIGAPADLVKIFRDVPVLFVLCLVMAAVNLAVTLVLGRLFKRNIEEIAIAVNATLGGAPSAAALAIARGWRPLVLPGILVGIWGYVIGTFVGQGIGWLLGAAPAGS